MDEKRLTAAVQQRLSACGRTLATAESCSGGLLARMMTELPDSSAVFWGGTVTYSNDSKVRLLGVDPQTLRLYGAVSAETAREMARGIRAVSGADYALAITGIAGPGGGSADKPVGLIYIALAGEGAEQVKECRFNGTRAELRQQGALTALEMMLQALPQ